MNRASFLKSLLLLPFAAKAVLNAKPVIGHILSAGHTVDWEMKGFPTLNPHNLTIMPPIKYPQGRPLVRWGAGVRQMDRDVNRYLYRKYTWDIQKP